MKKIPVPPALRYLWRSYLLGLAFFTGFRILLLCLNLDSLRSLPGAGSLLARSLYMGFRFDTVISSYLLILPGLLLCVAELFRWHSRLFFRAVHWLLGILYSLSFFGCAADIPFYNNYNTRLNANILTWTATPGFMIKMVLQEKAFLVYLILFLVVLAVFLLLRRRMFRRLLPAYSTDPGSPKIWVRSVFFLLPLVLLFLAARGRTTLKTPIQVGTAFFSPYNFPNQLGLNPMFTFIRSYLDSQKEENKYLQLTDEKEAIALMQHYLQVPVPPPFPDYPLARHISADTTPVAGRYNVVLVLMESMSASSLERYGAKDKLTPNLDRLAGQSYCFDNFYSAGLHTYNGIFSTLYGLPALLAKHSMYADVIPECTGLPYVLRQNGYHNMFFLTHDDQFDNIGPFLTVNHFDEVVGQKDYPSSEVISTLGIPDHLLFGHVLDRINAVAGEKKPFFAAVMTGSNHNPFEVPDGIAFKTTKKYEREGVIGYADWSVGQFMEAAAKQDWYKNTLFVFLGDHGAIHYDDMYADVSYSYSHIPLIIHVPGAQPAVVAASGSQPDVFPTVCGMLGLSYVNNTTGMDLLREQRPFTAFGADDKAAVTDNKYIYVWHQDGRENMFVLNKSFTEDVLPQQRAKADSMRRYLLSTTQVTQWMLGHGKAGPAH